MKRIIFYIVILLIAFFVPVRRTDITDLEPIQSVWINQEEGQYIITTDTEDVGIGESVRQAVEEMKNQSEKIIYLDTAQYLLVNENSREAVNDISQYLKGRVRVAIWNGKEQLPKAARYMQTHRLGVKLKDYFADIKLPIIPG